MATLLILAACGRQPLETSRVKSQTPQPWLGRVTQVAVPATAGSRFPNLAASHDGSTVVMSWLEPESDSRFQLRHARWTPAGAWSNPGVVAAGPDWFINWADFPSVVPLDSSRWVAHWLQQRPANVYSYDVQTGLSDDGGRTWSPPRVAHDDGTPTEHGFVSLTSTDGQPYAIWLDGRRTRGSGDGHEGHGSTGAMTLRGAELRPQGPALGVEIDDRVCDCCQTDVATVRDGLLVVYRDRTASEVRDIPAARYVNGQWSAPIPVHADGWRIDACPVNGPAVAARGDDVAVVSWLAETGGGAAIRAQPFTTDGPAGPAVDVATSDVARSSGFPQMLAAGDGLLFAWTEGTTTPSLRTAFATLH